MKKVKTSKVQPPRLACRSRSLIDVTVTQASEGGTQAFAYREFIQSQVMLRDCEKANTILSFETLIKSTTWWEALCIDQDLVYCDVSSSAAQHELR